MKNGTIKILIIICLSFFVSNYVSALDGCNWVKGKAIIVPGIVTSKWSCPDSNTKEAVKYSDCSGESPSLDSMCCCGKLVAAPAEPKFKLPDYVFQIPIPGFSGLSKPVCTTEGGVESCGISWISDYVFAIYTYGLTVVGVIAVLILMAAGLLWIVSGGDSGKINQAKGMIMGSVTGLLLIVGMNLLLSYINPDLVNRKMLVLSTVEKVVLEGDIGEIVGENPFADGCADFKKTKSTATCAAFGTKRPPGLANYEGADVNPIFLEKFKKAMACVAEKNGGKQLFILNFGFRTATKQIELWDAYVKCQATGKKDCSPAAQPCCSRHGSGDAADLKKVAGGKMYYNYNTSSGLEKCMNDNGLYNLKGEAWHWSTTGH